jgi:hypothetical protein
MYFQKKKKKKRVSDHSLLFTIIKLYTSDVTVFTIAFLQQCVLSECFRYQSCLTRRADRCMKTTTLPPICSALVTLVAAWTHVLETQGDHYCATWEADGQSMASPVLVRDVVNVASSASTLKFPTTSSGYTGSPACTSRALSKQPAVYIIYLNDYKVGAVSEQDKVAPSTRFMFVTSIVSRGVCNVNCSLRSCNRYNVKNMGSFEPVYVNYNVDHR